LVLAISSSFAQDTTAIANLVLDETSSVDWITHKTDDYTLSHPSDWNLDESKLMGTQFILFAPLKGAEDQFRENMNLIIEDVSSYGISLDDYIKISEKQLAQMITDMNPIKSERKEREGIPYQEVEYTGKQGVFDLHFIQHYIMVNGMMYVLTFTTEDKEFESYVADGKRILDSFDFVVH